MRIPSVIFAVLAATAAAAYGHSGGSTAFAAPVDGIVVDGHLDDWPRDAAVFPLRHKGAFYGITDLDEADLSSSPDLSAHFVVGFDEERDLLHVAVVVRDEALRLGPSWRHTDACEIYLDADHSAESIVFWPTYGPDDLAALQYVAIPGSGSYGPTNAGNPSVFLGMLEGTLTEMAFSRDADVTVYEWALQVHARFPDEPVDLRPGLTVGFDVVVVDKDLPTDNPARIGWAPFSAYKYNNADDLGDLHLVDSWEAVGSIRGRVAMARNGQPSGLAVVLEDIDGVARARAVTDRSGEFLLRALPGSYRVIAPQAERADTVRVELEAGTLVAGVKLRVDGVPERGRQSLLDSVWTFRLFVGALLAFAMLHMLLYLFYPALRENLDFALFTFFTAALLFVHFQMEYGEFDADTITFYSKLFSVASIAVFVSGLRFLYQLFERRLPKRFWLFLVAGVAWAALMWDNPWFPGIFYGFIVIPEMLRTTIAAIRKGNESAWIICVGFVLLTFTWLYQALTWINVFESVVEYVYLYGFVGMLVPMSVYLARDFALTNRHLAFQLGEVKRLSGLALDQERRARQEEVERRLLEADNDRKTRELEEARALQMALLPAEQQFDDNLDVAFYMVTATEVGGDYYDYVSAEDGSLVFAIGDATGHGARGSLIMATTKGLFKTLGSSVAGSEVLEQMAHGIHSMNLPHVNMSLTLVRLSGKRISVNAAGMPPVHIYRKDSGQVEEILLEAMPLGSARPTEFPQWEGELGPEDVVLLMTDGLPERGNRSGEQLGYERTVAAFAEAGEGAAAEICQHLARVGDAWADGQAQGDDVTFVAIKMPPAS